MKTKSWKTASGHPSCGRRSPFVQSPSLSHCCPGERCRGAWVEGLSLYLESGLLWSGELPWLVPRPGQQIWFAE